jgi:uncharacterized RDD family membrane protein YckC
MEGYGSPGGPSGPRAGFWRRFAALVVDGVVLLIVRLVFSIVLTRSLASLLEVVLGIGYYTYFEGSSAGQTPGKRALGIRVIDFGAGGSIGYARAAVRWLMSIVSVLALFIGYLWMLWDRERQTWHDKVSNAVVVPVADYPVERWP